MYMTLSAGSEVWHTHDGGPSYNDLKRHVGEGASRDLFDVVRLPNGIDLWVNDEGLIEKLPWSFAIKWWPEFMSEYRTQLLCGTVVAARSDAEGETVGLKEGDAEFLQGINKFLFTENGLIPVLFMEDVDNA